MINTILYNDLPENPHLAVTELCERIVRGHAGVRDYDSIQLIDVLTFFEQFCAHTRITVPAFSHALEINNTTRDRIFKYFSDILIPLKREAVAIQAKSLFDRMYFTEDEKKRLKEIIANLRELVSNSDKFTKEHKVRLIAKLKELLREVDSPVPNYDSLFTKLYMFTNWVRDTADAATPFLEPITEFLKLMNKLYPDSPFSISGGGFICLPPSDKE